MVPPEVIALPTLILCESSRICRHRHFPWGISHLFLLINVVVSEIQRAVRLR